MKGTKQEFHSRRTIARRSLAIIAAVLTLAPALAAAKFIDPERTWFAAEPTFQDQGMVNEEGRRTFGTPHKEAQFAIFRASLIKGLNAEQSATQSPINNAGFKPGYKINVPGVDTFVTDMEPVCIEVNKSPMRYYEQAEKWRPAFNAAKATGLVGYVNPAAERSGMGHFHVGGPTIADNPFFAHPRLLRNTMVYFHQHPSLLWGFAEAYDIGDNSNIESLHIKGRQERFNKAVADFDAWWESATPAERIDGGFKFLYFLKRHGGSDFFQHYRLINLQHVDRLAGGSMASFGSTAGKFTVEFRNIRPFQTPEQLQAMAEFLYRTLDRLADPEMKVPFRDISASEYRNFHSALVVDDDWQKVKSQLRLAPFNKIWDEMQHEYVANQTAKTKQLPGHPGVRIAPAYSEKENKGTYFEVSLPRNAGDAEPILSINGRAIALEAVSAGQQDYWVGVISAKEVGLTPALVESGTAIEIQHRTRAQMCRALFGT